jgi:hypothetical protein
MNNKKSTLKGDLKIMFDYALGFIVVIAAYIIAPIFIGR